jgi:MoxR-like ATPase
MLDNAQHNPQATPAHWQHSQAVEAVNFLRGAVERISMNVEMVLRGKRDVIHEALVCLLAGGHLLIEDVPGTGKTSLAKALARSIGGVMRRIQFTPDLLPTDIVGVSIFDQQKHVFEFKPGPVFAHVVVADEINRASPKTQSALLEVMEEAQVTSDGVAHPVPAPFFVVATQNPIDLDGTYRLPEAQLDRFLMRISVGHPDIDATQEVLTGRTQTELPDLHPVINPEQLMRLHETVTRVYVAPDVSRYIAVLADASRRNPDLRLGVSMRGCLALLRATQAFAACAGRHYVTPSDIKAVAEPVLAHRLVLTAQAEITGRKPRDVLAELLTTVAVPVSSGV